MPASPRSPQRRGGGRKSSPDINEANFIQRLKVHRKQMTKQALENLPKAFRDAYNIASGTFDRPVPFEYATKHRAGQFPTSSKKRASPLMQGMQGTYSKTKNGQTVLVKHSMCDLQTNQLLVKDALKKIGADPSNQQHWKRAVDVMRQMVWCMIQRLIERSQHLKTDEGHEEALYELAKMVNELSDSLEYVRPGMGPAGVRSQTDKFKAFVESLEWNGLIFELHTPFYRHWERGVKMKNINRHAKKENIRRLAQGINFDNQFGINQRTNRETLAKSYTHMNGLLHSAPADFLTNNKSYFSPAFKRLIVR